MSASFQSFLQKVGNLSEVKIKILKSLWKRDTCPFPKPWVKSQTLLKETQQKYFDRRTRELRDENGCDIENDQISGEYCYRLRSNYVGNKNPRGYLSTTEKEKLFVSHNFTCQICGRKYKKGEKGLQADHKIPLIRKGSQKYENWQPICVSCNVGKRRACEGCIDECKKCSWAFPEKIGKAVILKIPNPILEKLVSLSSHSEQKMQAKILEILKKELLD
jgi:5-methylcytosine-specific restriction endonuclease McrA